MRNLFLVTYDVCDARRLRKVYKKMHGFGKPAQYSVFLCPLSRAEKFRLLDQIGDLIKHDEDRVMIVDLGPEAGRGFAAVEFLGTRWELPADDPQVL
ncbi:MAG: CRISPR-associated endonuclease Cas2 [Candidatus Eisenbacteria bacterium]|uniref:CRISPR-associated endoribonuclease Cas2 n=1 Tax=Eiseniibacteriota bacterium TaxID=2212470 RepID=A0A956NEV5_UNCEI|nr:CRISPR-associated endonuclease Cas2 [Candidatus Eisenbacteria bacterium]